MVNPGTLPPVTSGQDNVSSWIPFYKDTYQDIVPFNLCLAVFILIQNSIIIMDYYKNRTRIIAVMFMCIAAADMVSAAGDIARATVGLRCLQDNDLSISPRWVEVYLSVGLCGYTCSVFYNTVLAITKTIHMVNPFYRINITAAKIALLAGTVWWVGVAVADNVVVYIAQRGRHHTHMCFKQWLYIEGDWYLGLAFLEYIFDFHFDHIVFYNAPGIAEVLLPCLIVLVCMVIQIIYIFKHLSHRSASYVNVTVLMVSVLYFVCNAVYGIYVFATDNMNNTAAILMQFTLPLLNAALFPLIVMARKPALRQRYMRFFSALFCFPRRLCRCLCRKPGVKTQPGVETQPRAVSEFSGI